MLIRSFMNKLYTLLFLLLSVSAFAQKTYIQCGKLIDGVSAQPRAEMTLVIEGNQITDIQKGHTSGGASDKIIDLKNKTVMPGLIDCHVHLENQHNKNTLLE